MSIVVEKLAPNEWAAYKSLRLTALQTDPRAFGKNYEEDAAKPDNEWQASLEKAWHEDNAIMLFAKDGEDVVGMIGAYGETIARAKHMANVYGMYVLPAYRSQGVGKLLFDSLFVRLRAHPHIKKLRLSVNTGQKEAIALYTACGFRIIGTAEKELYIDGEYQDQYEMEMWIEK